jgi:predicted Zn-dependent peptidase
MRRIVVAAALVAVAVSFGHAEDAARVRPPADDPVIAHEKYVLDNGLEVILIQDRSAPLVAVSVWYHVGSALETAGRSGFAHLFEHMLFQGSTHVGADKHFDTLQRLGATSINGTTNIDRTNYFEVVPAELLEAALWIESDRMGYFLPLLTEESLKNQIDVVRNERRQRIDNVAYGPSNLRLWEMLYPEGHPHRYQTIGLHQDLEAASVDDVRVFYRTWYVPANATLSLAGDFDVDEAKALVEKWFGGFPKSEKPAVVDVPRPPSRPARAEVEDQFAKLRRVTFAWHTPAMFDTGDAELDLVGTILGGGEASRLYELLVVDKELAQSVSAGQDSMRFSSLFTVTVTLRSDADLAAVEQLVIEEVERMRDEKMSDRELARAVTRRESRAVFRLEALLARGERLQSYNHYLGDPDRLSWDLERYRAATAESVRGTAEAYLDPAAAVVLVTVPAGGTP